MTRSILNVDPSGLLWMDNPTGSHESYWMGIQRFMYLNDLSGEEFVRLQYRRCHPFASPSRSALNKPVEKTIVARNFGFPPNCLDALDGDRLGNAKGNLHWYFSWEHPVRFCPECLSYGYHSLLFHFPAVERCPYHDVELSVTCVSCGAAVSRLGFIALKHKKPFCCTSCGSGFIPEKKFVQRVLFGIPDARRTLDDAYERIALVAETSVVSFIGFRHHDDRRERFARFHCHALHSAATHGAIKPKWLIGLEDEVSCEAMPPSTDPKEDARHRVEATDALRPLMSVVKSISRHLGRVIRSVCMHRSQPEYHASFRYRANSTLKHSLQLEKHDCPCCAVLSWWRANWGYYFALHEFLKSHGKTMDLWTQEDWLSGGMKLDSPTVIAQAAQDTFTSLTIQMHDRLAKKSEKRIDASRMLLKDSHSRESANRRNLALYSGSLNRHGFEASSLDIEQPILRDGSIICSDSIGHSSKASYSMTHAMKALVDLHELRQGGPLDGIDHIIWPYRRKVTFDLWYRQTWIDRNERTWRKILSAYSIAKRLEG